MASPSLRRAIQNLLTERLTQLPGPDRPRDLSDPGVGIEQDMNREILPDTAVEGQFLYYPLSDDAPYGWGDPYENPPGTPVNPPLGTVLAQRQCDVIAYTHDGDKHPFRLYDPSGTPQVEHGTNAKAGRFYWKYDDYVITWVPPIGIETYGDSNKSGEERGIYRNGAVLAYGPKSGSSPFDIKAAAIKKIGIDVYVYVCLATSSLSYVLQRAVVDPVGSSQVLTWERSTGMASVFTGVAPAYQTGTNFMLSACFNKSCTRLIINQPGRVFELDVSTWNSESLLNENYYWNNYAWLAGDPDTGDIQESDIEIPVVSGYAANSDTRRDLTIKIESRRNGALPAPNAFWTVFAKLDGEILKQMVVSTGLVTRPRTQAFLCMQPQFQDIQSGVFLLETHVVSSVDDPQPEEPGYDEAVCSREFVTEIYRELTLQAKLEVTEVHPVAPCTGPPSVGHDPEYFIGANNHVFRDASTYLGGSKNFSFIYPAGNWYHIDNDEAMAYAAGECIGVIFQDPSGGGAHWVQAHKPIQWGAEEPSLNYFQPHNYTAFAANWDGAFFLSARRFKEWVGGSPVFQWWNVGSTDLVSKTQMTGANPRFVSRPCSVNAAGEVKPANQHVGVLHVSITNPFA